MLRTVYAVEPRIKKGWLFALAPLRVTIARRDILPPPPEKEEKDSQSRYVQYKAFSLPFSLLVHVPMIPQLERDHTCKVYCLAGCKDVANMQIASFFLPRGKVCNCARYALMGEGVH